MIVVSCALQQDFVIGTIEAIKKYTYKFEKKSGINLKFSVDTEDLEDAVATAKAAIKATEIGSVLYFQVSAE